MTHTEQYRAMYISPFILGPNSAQIGRVEITNPGSGYSPSTTVTVTDNVGPGTGCVLIPYISGGQVLGLAFDRDANGPMRGSGYMDAVITISDGTGTGATAIVTKLSEDIRILGNTANEDALIQQYLIPKGINFPILYDLNRLNWGDPGVGTQLFPKAGNLSAFIKKLKLNGIAQVGAARGTSQSKVDQVYNYNLIRPSNERIDWFVIEDEYWQDNSFSTFLPRLIYAKNKLSPLGIKIAMYTGWYTQAEADAMAPYIDLMLISDYRSSPDYGYTQNRVKMWCIATNKPFMPIFSAEHKTSPWNADNNFMGLWYQTNNLVDSYIQYRDDFINETDPAIVANGNLVGQAIFESELLSFSQSYVPQGNLVEPVGPLDLCPDTEEQLSAYHPDAVSYLWYKDSISTGITTNTFTVTQAGEYYCEITLLDTSTVTSNTVVVTYKTSVVPNNLPEVESLDGKFCGSFSVTLKIAQKTRGFTYVWSTGEETDNITVTLSGDYRVGVLLANGCVVWGDYQYVYISDKLAEPLPVSGGAKFCVGNQPAFAEVRLSNSQPNIFYHLASVDNFGVITDLGPGTMQTGDGSTLVWDAVDPGRYTVIAVDDNSPCGPTEMLGSVTFESWPAVNTPTITPGVSKLVTCLPTTISSTQSPNGGSYEWSNGGTDKDLIVTQPGLYKVRVIDGISGCVSEWSTEIEIEERVPEDFLVGVAGGGLVFGCAGTDTWRQLYVSKINSLADDPDTYTWYRDGTPLVNGPGVSGQGSDTIIIDPMLPGEYSCIIGYTGGCNLLLNTHLFTQTTGNIPRPELEPLPAVLCPDTTLDFTVVNPVPSYNYDLQPFYAPLPLTASYDDFIFTGYLPGDTVDVYVSVYDSTGQLCASESLIYSFQLSAVDTDPIVVTANRPINSNTIVIYQGDPDQTVELTTNKTLSDWNTGERAKTITVSQPGTYYAYDVCNVLQSEIITVIYLPITDPGDGGGGDPGDGGDGGINPGTNGNPLNPDDNPLARKNRPEEVYRTELTNLKFRKNNPFSTGYFAMYRDTDDLPELFRMPIAYKVDEYDEFHPVTFYDDLWTLSFKWYGNSKYWWVIYDANNNILNPFELPVGEFILKPNLSKLNLED